MRSWDTLLLVGGPDSDRPMLCEIFKDDYTLLEADSIAQGMFFLEQYGDSIGAVLVDEEVEKDEDSFIFNAREFCRKNGVPLLAVISTNRSGISEERAFRRGASDIVVRTAPPLIMRRRVSTDIDVHSVRAQLIEDLHRQEDTIRNANEIMVDALSSIIEYRSTESGSHILRIRRFTEILLTEVSHSCPEYGLTEESIRSISSAAALHDIGKISIPDHILNKPGALTSEEFDIMKTHTTNGAHMIESLQGVAMDEHLKYAYNICLFHHERWTGKGYPAGLSGDDIPICAQVVGIADAFDALTTDRVYKKAIPPHKAVNMVLNGECGDFSPKLLACFKYVVQPFIDLAQEYADGRSPKQDKISLRMEPVAQPDVEVGSLQISNQKYEAMLHYSRATVVEMDLDHDTFHTVYNPTPNFKPVADILPMEKALDMAAVEYVHTDDLERVLGEFRFFVTEFFNTGLRKHSFTARVFSHNLEDYRIHEITFVRISSADARQRKALVIWNPVSRIPEIAGKDGMPTQQNKAYLTLTSTMVCRKNDRWFTLIQGSGNLTDLLGYSRREIKEKFNDRFLELVLPEDRTLFKNQVSQSLRVGITADAEYRIRHKDGRIIWVLEKGCAVTDDSGQEYFYGVLIDNTASHLIQEKMSEELRVNKMIIDQSDDVIVDWNMITKELVVSPNWKDIFGTMPELKDGTNHALASSRIYPDDIKVIQIMAENARDGLLQQEVELRMANRENRYVWFRLRLILDTDDRGRPIRALGVISNIDNLKRDYLALQEQAQKDSLTGLLNKAAAHGAVRSYLETRGSAKAALMMVDLDNFKGVNDKFGHLFGDTVLARTAQTIKRIFRGGDIIGRVGGDEFMVFMKDVPDADLVAARSQLLVDELSSMLNEDGQSQQVTCSLGVALAPEHGTSLQELFQHADQALYHSKQSGKHCFTIYRGDMEMPEVLTSTPIDSNAEPELAGNGIVQTVFAQLAASDDLEATINNVLALVGQRTNVSRVYIFENNDENTHCSNTFEWCNQGVTPEIDNLQDICYETDLLGWEDNYDETVFFSVPISLSWRPEPERYWSLRA